jgi:tetratricopeptide (TPR) repeat protein
VGEKFDPKLVADVISLDYTEVLITLNEISKRTLIVQCEGSYCKFDHIKFLEMLYEEIPLILKKEYHLRIAEKIEIEKQSGSLIPVSDLAYHFVKADYKIKAITYSLQAGKVALSQFSNGEAIQHFSYIIKKIGNDQAFIKEKLTAMEGLGDAYLANNMFRESMSVFKELGNISENEVVRLRAYRKAMDSAFQLGDISNLMDLIKEAEPYATADRLEHARILVSRGRAFHLRFMLSEATKDMEEALKIFEEEYSLWDVAWSLIGLGAYHAGAGRLQDGLAESLRSIALFEELDDFQYQIEAYYVAGMTFNFCFLEQEALKMFTKVSEIDKKEKIGDYLRLVYANSFSSRSFESIGNFKKALTYSLKALKSSEKTDSLLAKGVVYSDLLRQYARLGMMNHTEKYFKKLMQIPPKILTDPRTIINLTKPVFYATKNQWKASNQHFREILEKDSSKLPEFILNIIRIYYVWALKKQGRFDKAKFILEENQKKRQELEMQFNELNLRIHFMVPIRVKVGQKFQARLDIVNVSKRFCYLNSIENLINSRLKIVSIHPSYVLQNELIQMGKEILNPFQIKTIRFGFQTKYSGEITLNPKLIYTNEFGKKITSETKKVKVLIEPTSLISKIEFKSNYAQKAFDFLIKSFKNDYLQQKLPLEKSGWRTLMEIVKIGKVSKHSMYGRYGRGGKAISELENLGLVESHFFIGERGRGGRILKVRVSYENENVKQYLD